LGLHLNPFQQQLSKHMLEDIVIGQMWTGTPGARYKLRHKNGLAIDTPLDTLPYLPPATGKCDIIIGGSGEQSHPLFHSIVALKVVAKI